MNQDELDHAQANQLIDTLELNKFIPKQTMSTIKDLKEDEGEK